jgi:multidrug efflux pump subunit AcrA (membrane-fusion protein)
VAVDSGVVAGERVVTDGMDRLREGARVQVGLQR